VEEEQGSCRCEAYVAARASLKPVKPTVVTPAATARRITLDTMSLPGKVTQPAHYPPASREAAPPTRLSGGLLARSPTRGRLPLQSPDGP